MMQTSGLVEADVSGFGLGSQNIAGDDGALVVPEQRTDGRVRSNPIQMHHFHDGRRILFLFSLAGFFKFALAERTVLLKYSPAHRKHPVRGNGPSPPVC
jgi:hypothetical protein